MSFPVAQPAPNIGQEELYWGEMIKRGHKLPISKYGKPMLYVGCDNQEKGIENLFGALKGCQGIKWYSSPRRHSKSPLFLRDIKVIRPDGVHMVMTPSKRLWKKHKKVADMQMLWAVLPSSLAHFLTFDGVYMKSVMGRGMSKYASARALIDAAYAGSPFQMQKSTLEGGNIFYLKRGEERVAIVGALSLYISYVAHHYHGRFKEIPVDFSVEPSKEAFRIARNLEFLPDLFDALKEQGKKRESMEAFAARVQLPIALEEFGRLKGEATRVEHCLRLTKKLIAEDLNLPESHVVFVPQRTFHIDMEMAVDPDGAVLLHDEMEAVHLLEGLKENADLDQDTRDHITACLAYAKQHAALYPVTLEVKQALLSRGIEVKMLPLVFRDEEKRLELNYANGIFLPLSGKYDENNPKRKKFRKERIFLTSGYSEHRERFLHKTAMQRLRDAYFNVKIKGVKGISALVGEFLGGIRCLSLEEPVT